jgi:hypothetical protein
MTASTRRRIRAGTEAGCSSTGRLRRCGHRMWPSPFGLQSGVESEYSEIKSEYSDKGSWGNRSVGWSDTQ